MSVNAITRVPNRKVLKAVWALGLLTIIAGIGVGAFYFLRNVLLAADTCTSPRNNLVATVLCSNNLHWAWCLVIVLALVIGGLLIAIIARSQYLRYYVVVHTGRIVNMSENEYASRDNWQVKVEGLTLAGEQRTYWHPVSYDAYYKSRRGDRFPANM